jgi:hypothetical protein
MWAFAALMFAAVIGHVHTFNYIARLSHPLRDDVICIEGLAPKDSTVWRPTGYDSTPFP